MRRSDNHACPLSLVVALGLATTAGAQAVPPPADSHAAPSSDIVVTGPFARERLDLLSGVAVLAGAELTRQVRPTLGETLARTPGVSATSFGPNSSRPVLRGLQGERVRVLTDGIGAIDVSNTSVDHAVVVNPLLAERIEVLRGPATLLYGSAALGGVVNVVDRRIPRAVPNEPIHLDAIGTYGSAARERSISGAADAALGGGFVLHADGSYLKTRDLRIGGFVLSPSARRDALASSRLPLAQQIDGEGEPIDFAATAALRDRLPNSASKTWTAAAGAAYVGASGNVGLAYSHYDSIYGIPVRFATKPGGEQEAPRLDLKQDRIDGRGELDLGDGFLKSVRARAGYADYRHFELEEDGSVGTAFYSKGVEARLELAQAKRGAWQGASGAQVFTRRFNVVGDEAFLPRNRTAQFGLFTLQQFDFGALKAEAGGRYERSELRARPVQEQDQFTRADRDFDTFSLSGGASYALAQGWRLGANLSRVERAPSAEELFANGPHAGTEAYELGDPDFRKERAVGLEAVLRGRGKGYRLELSVYHNWFDNFIYQQQADQGVCEGAAADEDGDGIGDVDLPCYQSRQGRARYYGAEIQGELTLVRIGETRVVADALADYVHAAIRNSGPAPLIPPFRVVAGLGMSSRLFDLRGEVERANRQRRTATFETSTPGYTLVNAELTVRPWGGERPLTLALSANNIFDADARRHTSVLKDFAPLAGRDIRLTARASF